MTGAVPVLVILGSVVTGYLWGKISSRLAVPEWLRLMTTPVWTGALSVVAAWIISVARLDWDAPRVVDAAKLGPMSILRMAIGYGAACFLAGAVLGLPATLGWALGIGEPRNLKLRDRDN